MALPNEKVLERADRLLRYELRTTLVVVRAAPQREPPGRGDFAERETTIARKSARVLPQSVEGIVQRYFIDEDEEF